MDEYVSVEDEVCGDEHGPKEAWCCLSNDCGGDDQRQTARALLEVCHNSTVHAYLTTRGDQTDILSPLSDRSIVECPIDFPYMKPKIVAEKDVFVVGERPVISLSKLMFAHQFGHSLIN